MNPFHSSAAANADAAPVSTPWEDAEVVVEETSFQEMLTDVLETSLDERSGGSREGAPDNKKKNNLIGQPFQNPAVFSLTPPDLAPACPPAAEVGLETWLSSATRFTETGAQSLTELDAKESLSPAPWVAGASLPSDFWTIAAPPFSEAKAVPLEESLDPASPPATRAVNSAAASDDPKTLAGSPSIETSKDAPVERRSDRSSLDVGVSSIAPEDRQVAVREPGLIALENTKAERRADTEPQTNQPALNRPPLDQAGATGGEETGQEEPAFGSSGGEGVEVGPLRAENAVAGDEEMNPRSPTNPFPIPLRSGANARRTPLDQADATGGREVGEEEPAFGSSGGEGVEVGPLRAKNAVAGNEEMNPRSPTEPFPIPLRLDANARRTPLDQAGATGEKEAGEEEPAFASSDDEGREVGLPRAENAATLDEGKNSPSPAEPLPLMARPVANAQALSGSKTISDSALFRGNGGGEPNAPSAHTLVRVEQFQEFVSRLDDHILFASAHREKTMTVTLIPESLGKVVLNCREQGGQIWVEIQAANPSVREVLQRQEEGIRQLMDQSGCQLMQFDVRSQTGEGGQGHSHRRFQEEEEEAAAEVVWSRRTERTRESTPAAARLAASRSGLWVVA